MTYIYKKVTEEINFAAELSEVCEECCLKLLKIHFNHFSIFELLKQRAIVRQSAAESGDSKGTPCLDGLLSLLFGSV